MSLRLAKELLERLKSGERFLADGAIGTELIRYGVPAEDVLRANIGMPEEVRRIHDRYLDAGATILKSNTFGLRSGDDWLNTLHLGVDLSMAAAKASSRRVSVWNSLIGDLVPVEIENLKFLASHCLLWPDAILIETCTTLKAAVTAAKAARIFNPALLAVTCHFRADGRMPDDSMPEDVARALIEAGADVVGGNCGEAPEAFVEIAARMRAVTEAPLLFAPSAGLPSQEADGPPVYPVGPEAFAEIGLRLFDAGASVVGGCCGTTPAHIAVLHSRVIG